MVQHRELIQSKVASGLSFDVYKCSRLARREGVLVAVAEAIVQKHDLLEPMSISKQQFRNFLLDVQMNYRQNQYHNSIHAADMLQAVDTLVSRVKIVTFTKYEHLLIDLAATCHDVGHPGLNNAFYLEAQKRYDREQASGAETAVEPELAAAAAYAAQAGEEGVNEFYHAQLGWQLVQKHKLLQHLGADALIEAEAMFKALIYGTDMRQHKSVLEAATAAAVAGPVSPAQRLAVMAHLVHCGDLLNPCRSPAVAMRFGMAVCLEFITQARQEQRLFGRIISAFCDPATMVTPLGQLGFIKTFLGDVLQSLQLLCPEVAAEAEANMLQSVAVWQQLLEAGMKLPLPDGDRTVEQVFDEVKQQQQSQEVVVQVPYVEPAQQQQQVSSAEQQGELDIVECQDADCVEWFEQCDLRQVSASSSVLPRSCGSFVASSNGGSFTGANLLCSAGNVGAAC